MTDAHTKATFNGLGKAVQGVTEWSKTIDNMFEVSINAVTIIHGKRCFKHCIFYSWFRKQEN